MITVTVIIAHMALSRNPGKEGLKKYKTEINNSANPALKLWIILLGSSSPIFLTVFADSVTLVHDFSGKALMQPQQQLRVLQFVAFSVLPGFAIFLC